MSARSGLKSRLTLFGLSAQAADRAIDAFAHELAEKIREDVQIHGNWACCAEACGSAADLIDPEHDGS